MLGVLQLEVQLLATHDIFDEVDRDVLMPTHEGFQLDADEPLEFYLGAVMDSDALAGDAGCLSRCPSCTGTLVGTTARAPRRRG